jgi:hypothetical protein
VLTGKLAVSAELKRFKGVIMDDQDLSAPSVEARIYQLIFGYMAVPAMGESPRSCDYRI